MPSGGLGNDEDTFAGASFGNVRQPATLVKSADLQTALTPLDENDFGTKIYENIGLIDFTPAPVTRVGEVLRLRSYFMSQLGPRYLWIIKLSMIEWPTLSAQEKKLHAAMRKSFVTSYSFGAEAILQHWLWKTLKNATKSFGPLLKVFATDYDTTTTCVTDAWESIFTLFPRAGAAITHQLIVRGFEQCMSIHDDSTATFTKYIALLNESLAQLATVKPMSISEIYALATLMGLHLSPSARHERAYRDLMTFIDEGNALMLEEVLKIGLKYSRDSPFTANAFAAVRAADAVCTRACPICCTRGRSTHPSSRNSSRAGSRHGSPRPGARAFSAVHDHEYWNMLGLDKVYHTYDALLEVNCISPHQVLLERKIDDFSHKDAGDSIPAVAARFPHSDVNADSDLDTSRECVLFCWGTYTDFLYEGLFIWRAVCMSVFLYSFWDWINFSSLPDGLRQFLFGDHNPFYAM
jgi:hypothetical protein